LAKASSSLVALGGCSSLLSTDDTHLACWIQVWTLEYKPGMNFLQQAQQRAMKTIKGLGDLAYEERLESWDCSAWRIQGLWASLQCVYLIGERG